MIRKQDTILRVAEPTQLMDFLIAKMGGMARSSVKQLLGQAVTWSASREGG